MVDMVLPELELQRENLSAYLIDGAGGVSDRSFLSSMARWQRKSTDHVVIYHETGEVSRAAGAGQTLEAVESFLAEERVPVAYSRVGSLGLLSAQPVIGVQIPGRNRLFYGPVQPYEVPQLLRGVLAHQLPDEGLLGQWGERGQSEWEGIRFLSACPFFKGQERRLMRLNGIIDPENILEYIAWGGYHAFANSLRYSSHQELVRLVEQSGLIGRSGSGFPVYLKWKKALSYPASKLSLICNADESDPGAFMHRILMEGNPHLVLEGIMLAAYAVGAREAVFHTRSRYQLVVQRMEKAISQARKAGLIGTDIFGSGYSLEIKLNKGPGAYVTGEETALIASLEGKRGMPRPKPPYPAESGINGRPTIVHNVETLAQLTVAVSLGASSYRSVGTQGSAGTKLFSLAGKARHTGVIEVPYGMSVRQVLSAFAFADEAEDVKAVFMGGLAGRFIPASMLDLTLDADAFTANQLEMGSGSVIILDEKTCILDLVNHLMHFIQKESCGKCIPCREGTRRMAEILDMVVNRGMNRQRHEALLRFKGVTELTGLAHVIAETSLCGLGKGAANPLLSALEHFRDEFEEHVFDRVCRAGICRDLRTFYIDPEACTGCYVCFNKCPVQAIIGTPRQPHAIMQERCTGCGICQEVCKFNAVLIK